MNPKPVLLIFVALLLVVAAAWADAIPHAKAANDTPSAISRTKANAPAAHISASATSSLAPIDNPDSSDQVSGWGTISPVDLAANSSAFESESDNDNNPADSMDQSFYEIVSSGTHPDAGRLLAAHNRDLDRGFDRNRHHDREPHSHAFPVPEPGSLDLVLLGLAALGLSAIARIMLGSNEAPRTRPL